MKDAVKVSGLRFERNNLLILDDISLSFPAEASTVVMGSSGSGKSTLLKIAAGIIMPDGGRVELYGENIFGVGEKKLLQLQRRTGFVFQDAALWANMSLYSNMEVPLRYHYPDMTNEEVDSKINQLLKRVDFREDLSVRPAQLSTGEQKIFSFLRALVTEPELVFLDEPTTSVDQSSADKIINLIRKLKEEGKTIIAVTHSARLTSLIADYLIVMGEGGVLAEGPFSEVIRTKDQRVADILSDVLDMSSSYDTDLLELLEPEFDDE
ncbi:MAG: ATP-binding cassette domain-containing protein [Spirochaetales bacterium]|nr:ATP-binding cassette domain-containing protein [Spirochaetales bacterium]MCF7937293.1 ATP-binding cassette domain-containing protein [Spirochaetales bacterium]